MSAPLVSVCLPNLNTMPYLRERVDTILAQTFTNWELIVSDNYSEDGAWAFFEELAKTDSRVLVAQAPREGLYANWNQCLQRASGEYIYIATSDDTMPPDCLEKLVAALQSHPECDLAHCALRQIDAQGRDVPDALWPHSEFAVSSGPLLQRPHIRRAPFDGFLHLNGGSVYISITQLLIRRSLFERIGWFESRWGSLGDFNWNMRAGLVANTVHVPDTWGGWRVHATQATAAAAIGSDEHARRIDSMIEHALASCGRDLPQPMRRLAGDWASEAKARRAFMRQVAARRQDFAGRRWAFLVRRVCSGSAPAREYVASRLLGRSTSDWVRRRLAQAGSGPLLVPTPTTTPYSSMGAELRREPVPFRPS